MSGPDATARPDEPTERHANETANDTANVAASTDGDAGTVFDLALVGGGNMGAALLRGWLDGGGIDPADVVVVEPRAERRAELCSWFPGLTATESLPPHRSAVLAVKPPDIAAMARRCADAGADRVLSIAAGVTTATLAEAVARPDRPVAALRAMPNTPSLVGHGVAALCGAHGVGEADLAWGERLLSAVGTCVRVEESLFDAVTAVTGSGPAYLFLFAEALVDAARGAGLPEALCEPMVTELLVGSAALLASEGDPAALRAMVTSPNGTTAAGVAALEAHDLRGTVTAAVRAAAARSVEMRA